MRGLPDPSAGRAISPQPNAREPSGGAGFSPAFWLVTIAIGAGSGLAAGLLMHLLHWVQALAWHDNGVSFLHAVQQVTSTHRVLVLTGTGLLVACSVPLFAALPAGAPRELEAAIWFADGKLPVARTLLKAVFSIVVVGLGASLGRESAPKQVGTLIGGRSAAGFRFNASQRRLLAACGAGAGIAAVYNVPFGGALFAMEVLLGSLELPLVAPTFLASLTGTATAWLLLSNEPTYHLPAMPLTAGLIAFALCLGSFAGVASALFIKLIAAAARLKVQSWRAATVPVVVFASLGALSVPYPALLGNGKNIVELAALGALAPSTAVVLLWLKPLATAACLLARAPGGLFTPTLALGALLGGVFGQGWQAIWPGEPAGAFALLGAGAILAATSKGPISALVLLLELTRNVDGLVVPLMLAIAGALLVADALERRSIYSGRIRTASPETDPSAVSTATSVAEVARLLACGATVFPVKRPDGSLRGTIGADDLATALPALYPQAIATALDVLECKERQDRSSDPA